MLTDKTKTRIIKLWEEGLTGGQIAEKLHLTRCSVLGFISRKRKSGHIFERIEKKAKKEKTQEPKKTGPFWVRTKKTYKENKEALEELLSTPVVLPTRDGGIDLMDLKLDSCRFIISSDDDPVKYCGHQKARESYCAEHYSLCYYPARMSLDKLVKI